MLRLGKDGEFILLGSLFTVLTSLCAWIVDDDLSRPVCLGGSSTDMEAGVWLSGKPTYSGGVAYSIEGSVIEEVGDTPKGFICDGSFIGTGFP